MKDGEELQVSCAMCKAHTGFVRQVATPVGSVKVRECMQCDRTKCTSCNARLPGWASSCPTCNAQLQPPASEAGARLSHPSMLGPYIARAVQLVEALAQVGHPELAEAIEELQKIRGW